MIFFRSLCLAFFLSFSGVAFAVTPVPCTGGADKNTPDYAAGYFTVTNTSPGSQVYSASQAIMVSWVDAGFVAWQAQFGNCVYTFPTLVSMYAQINSVAASNWSVLPSYYAASSAANVTLTNAQLGTSQINMTTSGKNVTLPNMGLSKSPPVGGKFRIVNSGATNSFGILDSAGSTVVSSLPPQTFADLTVVTFGGPSGSASWTYTSAFGTGGSTVATTPAAVSIGGTGLTSITPYALVTGGTTSTGAMSVVTPGATGQVFIGNTGSFPQWATAGTDGQVFVGRTANDPRFATMSQDCTITNAGVVTCLKTNNVAFAAGATNSVAAENARLGSGNINVTVTGIDFSTVSEKLITIPLPTGVTRWAFQQGRLYHASTNISTAFVQLWSGSGGTGTAILGATAVSVNTASANTAVSMQQNIIGPTNIYWNFSSIYIRVSTGIGSAATADFTLSIVPLD